MNTLLAGAHGNLGAEICRQATFEVSKLGRDDWGNLGAILDGKDTVIHAASDLRTRASVAPAALMHSNVMSTALLLEAAKRHAVRRFVFMSSCAVYGEDMRTSEDSLCAPITINGISKLLNENLVAEFCTANRIEFQILRVFNTYGGNDKFSILSWLERAVVTNTPFTLNNMGRMQRDFIHVADVASVVCKLLQHPVKYSHLNIGTGVATKISAIVDLVAGKFPQLVVTPGVTREAEYSRADISRLNEVVQQDFIQVGDFVRERFKPEVLLPDRAAPSPR